MKLSTILPMLAAFTASVNAEAFLGFFEDEVYVGKSYTVEWLEDATEVRARPSFDPGLALDEVDIVIDPRSNPQHLTLKLIRKDGPDGFGFLRTLFKHKLGSSPGGNFTLHIDDSFPTGQ